MKFRLCNICYIILVSFLTLQKQIMCYDGMNQDFNINKHGTFIRPTMKQLSHVAEKLEKSLNKIYEEYIATEFLPKKDERIVAEDVNSKNILENLSQEILKIFISEEKSLKNIVQTLESTSDKYEWRDEQENNNEGVVYMNITVDEKGAHMPHSVSDQYLGIRVNKSQIGIHIPLEVYEGYSEILNGLNWSSVVDETFKKNKDEDESLAWQYFASQTGFMRLYPSVTKWFVPPPYTHVDLFDARRRPWYIRSSTYSKDVIVLMDRSGSVHGQTFTIMKFAVGTLIDTLGENDYFNVAAFNESTSWVSEIIAEDDPRDCSVYNESLIRATNVNKRALVDDIQQLSVKGIANFSDAIQFAYEVFKERSLLERPGRGCHKLIMIFSDGGTEWPEEVIKKYRNSSGTSDVRIFTYALGPHPIPTAVLKDLACETGGKFTVITTSSGVRTKIQDSYIGSISQVTRPLEKRGVTFTSAYTSAVTGNLTLTMSMPVFNFSRNMEEDNSTELLGVAGVDIPLQLLLNLIPKETLGPVGYAFIINLNGMVVLHPLLKPQQSYLENQPNLDLLELEPNYKELRKVRQKMINRESGTTDFWGDILLDKFHFSSTTKLQYDFQPILQSPYSMGIFTLPSAKYLKAKRKIPLKTIDPRTSNLAPWNFCGSYPAALKPDLINKRILEDETQCDEKLINQLMWAQEWTNALVERWESEGNLSVNLINRAIYTRFGLARIVTTRKGFPTKLDSSTATDESWRNPYENVALKRAVLDEKLSVFPYERALFLSRPAYMNNVPVAAVGVNITSNLLEVAMSDILSEESFLESSVIILADDSATVISSSQQKGSCGKFLGDRWPLLLEKLVEAGVYGTRNMTNYQAYCKEGKKTDTQLNSASLVRLAIQPFSALTSFAVYVLTLLEHLQCLFIHSFFSTSSFSPAEALHRTEEFKPCILQHKAYYFTDRRQFSGNISCLDDSAQVLVRRLDSTNLILIAVEKSLVNLNCDGGNERNEIEFFDFPLDLPSRFTNIDPKNLACRLPLQGEMVRECENNVVKPCSGVMNVKPNKIYGIVAATVLCLFKA